MENVLDWQRISFWFPEFDLKEKFKPSPNPEFLNGTINFSMENKYGGQIFLNHKIPKWVEEKKVLVDGEDLNKVYQRHCQVIYYAVLNELTETLPIFERWRKFLSKHDGETWVGNLQNNLSFGKTNNEVNIGDYYSFDVNSQDSKTPTEKILLFKDIPSKFLNEEAFQYHQMAQNVNKGGKHSCDSIFGKSISDCVKNTDEIYKIADKLRNINF